MPFVTKRKAHMQAMVHARQTKKQKIVEDLCEQDEGRVQVIGEGASAVVVDPCTLSALPQSNELDASSNNASPDPLRAAQNPELTPLRFVFAPHSDHSANDKQPCIARRHATDTSTVEPTAQVLITHSTDPVHETPNMPDHTHTLVLPSNHASDGTGPSPSVDLLAHPKPSDKAPPSSEDAARALGEINRLLRPPRNKGPGYKPCKLKSVTRKRCEAMATCLRFFLYTNATFIDASEEAAIGNGHGVWHARKIRAWIRRLIATGDLPARKSGQSGRSLLKHEDIESDVKLFLQQKGKYFVADDIVEYLNDPDVKRRLTITQTIHPRTVQRWLESMEYRWQGEQPGQYFDGHERPDVVQYRQDEYTPKLKAFEPFVRSWDAETGDEKPLDRPIGQRQVIIWWHDASTFYAHDRRKRYWRHKNKRSQLAKKGQGVSVMVADFVSGEFGFLKSRDRQSHARKILHAGKNREGYMTNTDICEQFKRAVDLVKREYPDQDHVFIYDNARIHTKRSPATPSARFMTKGESDFGVYVFRPDGTKLKVPMENPHFPNGSEQQLYLPNGRFKGMVTLLRERGYDTAGLKAECRQGFKCDNTTANCCCRRILFNLIDLNGEQKSVLQILAKQNNVQVIYLPKFHCELNPIEQCWGSAKRTYRTAAPSSLTADVEKNMLQALNQVPLKSIRRFVMRSRRFVDAYNEGLDGPNAAASDWVRKKFKGHRATLEHIDM